VSLAALIAAQRVECGIPHAVSCRALGVSQAWFYKWRRGDRSLRRKRRAALASVIAYLFKAHRGSYGSPRITADLREMGWKVSKNTVAKLMAEQALVARRKRRRRSSTRRDKSARKAPDVLRRDFRPPAKPNTRWVGDLTEIPTDQGKLYLAAIVDLHGRRCAWPSPSAAGPSPAWSSIPTKVASTPGGCSPGPAARRASPSPWDAPGPPWTMRSRSRSIPPWNGSCSANGTSPPASRPGERSRRSSTSTTPPAGTSTNGMLSPLAYEHANTAEHQPEPPQAPPDRSAA
jgi:hypothetical protein